LIRDLKARTTRVAGKGSGANGIEARDVSDFSLSADGQYVAFVSNDVRRPRRRGPGLVFVRDVRAKKTTLASRASGAMGAVANGETSDVSISADGRYVAFQEEGGTGILGWETDENTFAGFSNVYLRDIVARTTTVVSRPTGSALVGADGDSWRASISAKGRFVAFESMADNLSTADDDALFANLFVRDLVANTTTLVSRS
jgi:Tol biopolymer transport system component